MAIISVVRRKRGSLLVSRKRARALVALLIDDAYLEISVRFLRIHQHGPLKCRERLIKLPFPFENFPLHVKEIRHVGRNLERLRNSLGRFLQITSRIVKLRKK